MSIDRLVELIHAPPDLAGLEAGYAAAFDDLFGSASGRYPANARTRLATRLNASSADSGIPFAAFIHPANPVKGMYGGMSIAIFPVPDAPALVTFVVGTAGLSPDEDVLGRPGHARKVQAICTWLNRAHGRRHFAAWSKQDPTRTDIDIPTEVRRSAPSYASVFERYGRVLYAVFAPTATNRAATKDALTSFFDLLLEERGFEPLTPARADQQRLRDMWWDDLTPSTTRDAVFALLTERKYVVIQGPPGTGKTRLAGQLLTDEYARNGAAIQFHPNTTYEGFVGGLAPVQSEAAVGLNFSPVPGHLMRASQAAAADPSRPYLLHIDEVNRADLGKVLGESIFLFEPGEEREILMPFDFGNPFGERLSLPSNLHILGTMNTADRSLAAIDVAVRRRFSFVKLWPQLGAVSDDLMRDAFIRLFGIFVEHASGDAFDLVPGHSYFLKRSGGIDPAKQLKVTLVPLLEEYLSQGYVAGFSEHIRAYLQWVDGL